MLVAVAASGRRQVASADARGETFSCPDCGEKLVVRVPLSRVAHFAHLPGSRCRSRLSKSARRAEARSRAAQQRARRRREAESAGQDSLFDLDVPT